ncbi:MAG TPA: adenylate/guanylate cyclase domain-containing protein [Stellaceae bacterium]|nr:adenylate/guanylate cyclase domain-containing protein [Stellaceae bacterium]
MLNPIKSLIRSAAVVGTQQPDFYKGDKSLKYLLSILQHGGKLVSVYVGLGDGSFRQARVLNPGTKVQGKLPPAGVSHAYRWIDAPRDGSAIDHYTFLDAEHTALGSSEQATSYDPRVRLWYRQAAGESKIIVTDPEVFAVFGLIGFTIAAPIYADGAVAGVAAADITLDGLSQFLSERKISPGTLSFILDTQGGVLANSELAKTYADTAGDVALRHITSLDNRLPAIAYSARPRNGDGPYSFSYGGRNYVASCATLPPWFGKSWQLFTITPLEDFTGPFDHNDRLLFIWGLIGIGTEILIIYFLSAMVSAPLEQMARSVAMIERLDRDMPAHPQSPVTELSVLSRAIGRLGATVESFAAFVPVGLVRQLMTSDGKLELGGHSRFLTIFFSDLEAFSTLSEDVPSHELLTRVSAYLEAVSKAINAQAGTIDKFIGDGVMAFWGAPALLEDHAWRACLAALRAQRAMDELNASWERDELKPLKLRMGIHSDAVLVGNIGSSERMGYTVIGDGVNIAARLQEVNKEYGTRICISHAVFREAGERLCVRPIGDAAVKGRRGTIPIYELLGAYGAGGELEPDAAAVRLCRLTRAAHEAMKQEAFGLALSRYQAILDEFPGDPVSLVLVRRLNAMRPAQALPAEAAE